MKELTNRRTYRSLLTADTATKVKIALILLAGLACVFIMFTLS